MYITSVFSNYLGIVSKDPIQFVKRNHSNSQTFSGLRVIGLSWAVKIHLNNPDSREYIAEQDL